MSQENVEIVRKAYEAWEPAWGSGTSDLGALLEWLDDDLVTRNYLVGPEPDIWHGHQGFLEMSADAADIFEEFRLRGEEFIEAGDHVVVRAVMEGRGGDSGAEVRGTFWYVYGVRGGKLTTIDMYAVREQALEAVGISE